MTSSADNRSRALSRRLPLALIAGTTLLLALQAIHFAGVLGYTRGTALEHVAQVARDNITPFAWCAYLLFLMGILSAWDRRSWLRAHRFRFLICWVWSVPAWCYFDWMNFYFMRDPATGLRAWEYIHLPLRFNDRVLGYLVAFGAIAPGMFLTSEVLQRAGLWRVAAHGPGARRAARRIVAPAVLAMGLVLAPIPIVVGTPQSNLAIWVGTWAMLDPVNYWCGRPSILGDWFAGRFGRTLALGAGGLACGFLWEFWNYWATTKWVYHLPFLGQWEQVRYFEMPVPGLIGFIAFGIETWTMWQAALLVLGGMVEGERRAPGDQAAADYSCL